MHRTKSQKEWENEETVKAKGKQLNRKTKTRRYDSQGGHLMKNVTNTKKIVTHY